MISGANRYKMRKNWLSDEIQIYKKVNGCFIGLNFRRFLWLLKPLWFCEIFKLFWYNLFYTDHIKHLKYAKTAPLN